MTRLLVLSASLLGSMVIACAAGNNEDTSGTGGGTTTSTNTQAGGAGPGGAGGAGAGFNTGGGQGGSDPYANAEVFGHSSSTLYRLDPITKAVTTIGQFNGCDDVIDIAIDKDGQLLATSYTGLHRIDKTSAECTLIATGVYPNSLSFVPVGTLDATVEALVGYENTNYVRINPDNGNITTVNAGAIMGGLISSGDIVSVIDGGTYLTVKGPGCENTDCLVEVNPATGAIIQNFGDAENDQIFGLAFWGGSAYGFTNDGILAEIIFMGNTVTTTPIAVPGAPAGLQFWGAGSSTDVPIAPPE